MAIKVNKLLPVGNTGQSVTHWLVTKVVHRHNQEKVIIEIIGFFNKAKRNEGLYPLAGAFRRYQVVNKTYIDDEGVEQTENNYNKWNNFKLNDQQNINHPIPRGKHFEKYQVLDFFSRVPDMEGLETED